MKTTRMQLSAQAVMTCTVCGHQETFEAIQAIGPDVETYDINGESAAVTMDTAVRDSGRWFSFSVRTYGHGNSQRKVFGPACADCVRRLPEAMQPSEEDES